MGHQQNELRRLYEPLSLLCALNEQFPVKRSIAPQKSCGITLSGRLRHLIDAIVRLGAFKMDSDLAGVILNRDNQATFIIAGSEPCDQDVVPFLEILLQIVIEKGGPKGEDQAIPRIVAHVMDMHKDKVFDLYLRILNYLAPICLPKMGRQSLELEGKETCTTD